MNQASQVGTGMSTVDERAITAVLIGYATAIDQRDWKLFRSLFTSDCEADYGSFGKWSGAGGLTEYMRQAHAHLGSTLHRISNIEIRSDEGGVHARCYVDALLKPMNEGGPVHRGIGYYDDQFVRTALGWQIARRHFHALVLE